MRLELPQKTSEKALLAFSAGIDSTALFFLLLEQNIVFDIAIVDYNIREQAKEEIEYAKELASKYNKKIYTKSVTLENSNFEKEARDIRYKFFEDIIQENNYDYLYTAHQLNDKLEWFLMQLSKGAGLPELIGLNNFQEKETYKIHRPILNYTKDELQNYLDEKKIKYFIDSSNYDEKYKRNYFRHNFSNKFLEEYKEGVKKSFTYLEKDLNSLQIEDCPFYKKNDLFIYKNKQDDNINIRLIDKKLKLLGVLISKAQRDEILKQKNIIISNKIVICLDQTHIWICPKVDIIMDKKFKEICRILKIPKLVRPYLKSKNIDIKKLQEDLLICF